MKEIVLRVDDVIYRRAEGIANARKISLIALVGELVESATPDALPNPDDIKASSLLWTKDATPSLSVVLSAKNSMTAQYFIDTNVLLYAESGANYDGIKVVNPFLAIAS